MEQPDLNIRRLYYSMSEVSTMAQIDTASLRAWEKKFSNLRPTKSRAGRRLYRPNDVKTVMIIKKLKQEGYTEEKICTLLQLHTVKELYAKDVMTDRDKVHTMMFLTEMYAEMKEILHLLKK